MELSRRLLAVAEFVPPGRVVADIGTDHACLPVYLVQTGRSPRVIATELNEKPWERALSWVTANRLESKIEVRRGAGLEPLAPGEVQAVVVAGLGGKTIKQLLAAAPEVLCRLERLVLQPMADAGDLRLWLADQGWRLAEEALVEEDGRLYAIIAAAPGKEAAADRFLIEIGPRLAEKGGPLFLSYLEQLKRNCQRVLSGLERSRSPEAQEKAIRLTARLAKLREMMTKYARES
ncbi:MAG: class I SAM-dependent methyltransferase [Armatimonadetes bacterium]|nr:class I SAM-dependent methyltransferase [Armatimonadota bacterium]